MGGGGGGVEISGPVHGKGYWKINNEVLTDAFRESFTKIFTVGYCIKRARAQKEDFVAIHREIAGIHALRNIGDRGVNDG